ncbi:GNAT family N-acetyltransferase [Rickettsia asembonensis]|uniref:GNAT family N-acetyltransferase n=1 Tax=Rickettsia asembonensis TaxID=1068590 RepID=UPI000694DADC|nr:GNAT family N-acetyltransferase [Rickettsia asembonensis]
MQPIFTFRVVNFTEKNLSILIADSIGNPTTEKISQVLESYKNTKLHLIGCFIEENLIGIIGIEVLSIQAIIRHISVLKTFRSQGIGKQLILYIISHFTLKKITAETDDSAVNFYRALGFNCKIFERKYNQRYNCSLHFILSSDFVA